MWKIAMKVQKMLGAIYVQKHIAVKSFKNACLCGTWKDQRIYRDVCKKNYTQKHNLVSHELKIHNIKKWNKITICALIVVSSVKECNMKIYYWNWIQNNQSKCWCYFWSKNLVLHLVIQQISFTESKTFYKIQNVDFTYRNPKHQLYQV